MKSVMFALAFALGVTALPASAGYKWALRADTPVEVCSADSVDNCGYKWALR